MTPAELSALERAFDLQMWALGCDARHPEGNLFARRGLRRVAPPPGAAHSSTWHDDAAGIAVSSLGVEVRRGDVAHRLERGPIGPQLRGVPGWFLTGVAAWLTAWEAWVDATAGQAWRPRTLSERRRPAPLDAAALRERWATLAAGEPR